MLQSVPQGRQPCGTGFLASLLREGGIWVVGQPGEGSAADPTFADHHPAVVSFHQALRNGKINDRDLSAICKYLIPNLE
jgi:hypothetical protein